jgi:hypothetical protein
VTAPRPPIRCAAIEDHVAGLDAVVRRRSIGIDGRNGDALIAGAADIARRGEREAEARRTGARGAVLVGAGVGGT